MNKIDKKIKKYQKKLDLFIKDAKSAQTDIDKYSKPKNKSKLIVKLATTYKNLAIKKYNKVVKKINKIRPELKIANFSDKLIK